VTAESGLNTKRLNVDGLLLTGVYASPSAENWTSYVHRHLEPTRSSDQTKSTCPLVKGRARSQVTWPGGFSGRAHTCTSRSEGSRSSGLSVRRPLAGKGRGATATGSWGQGLVLRALGSRQPPCPIPHPASDLGSAHAPELLCRGEDRPAEALPLAMGAAEPVVQVQGDIDEPCGGGRWSHASPGPPPPEPPLPREPSSPGPGGTPCRRRVKATLRLAWSRVSSLA